MEHRSSTTQLPNKQIVKNMMIRFITNLISEAKMKIIQFDFTQTFIYIIRCRFMVNQGVVYMMNVNSIAVDITIIVTD